ncbi:hypothetical protein Golob_017329 [Gossypium lobatum]|uniref:Uncharacterized protein n=1 Tax=Gossypium lobatum TaxID=34289 RepID=A0A7J8M718_9ROSI|nr:hypothetical protein [Gossypium lobatum]
MDGRRWGGDGGRGRPKRSRVSATDGGNEPREGSTSPTATQNPSAVIGQEQEAEPRRFTSHNYTRSPSRSPPQSRPPIRRTPSYPPPRTFPPSCQPPRPPIPTAPIRPPRPLKSFPQRAEQPLRQPSLALSHRHSSPDRPQRNQPTTTTKRKRSEKSKDGNDEEGDPRRPASGIVIRDQQTPSSIRSREAQQGNSDDPDSDHTPAPGQSAGPVRDQGMVGLQNQEGKPYSDRDLPLKKRTSVRAMVDGNGGNQEGAPVAEGNPPPSAQQRYRRDRAAKGNEHQAL